MQLLLPIILLAFCAIVPFYMYAFSKLFKIVNLERPEWFGAIPDSFFTRGLPKSSDPNYQYAFIRIVFSPKIFELNHPMAQVYAKRIRVLLPLGLGLFATVVIGVVAYGK